MKALLFALLFGSVCAYVKEYKAKSLNSISYKSVTTPNKRYKPTWDDLDTRPLPQWYDKAKIGIFIHWGIYSVPSFGSEWFWVYWRDSDYHSQYQKFMEKNYPLQFSYQDFAPLFTAEFFVPNEWALLFAQAGAKYVVLTSKHHDGFTLFPSNKSFSWNAMDTGPHRDLVGGLAKAVKHHNMTFGLYHSLYEWYNPIYLEDKKMGTRQYPDSKLWPDLKQIINTYKPSVLWADGDWDYKDDYWNSTDFLAWMYNDSPVKDSIVTNDRWGKGIPGKHGDFYNNADRYNPGYLLKHKWESAFTLDRESWGYRREMKIEDVYSVHEVIKQVVGVVSCGGNALINVGPTKEGTIPLIFQDRLLGLGEWLKINGEAIYESSPWKYQNDTLNGDVWYTCNKENYNEINPIAIPLATDKINAIYAISVSWPSDNVLKMKAIAPLMHAGNYNITLLGNEGTLPWKITNGTLGVRLPDRAAVMSEHAWTLKFVQSGL